MIHVLHVLDSRPDFQTRRCVDQLARRLGGGFESAVRTIGPGGSYPRLPSAARALRSEIQYDLLHAWGTRALTAAALGWRGRIIYSPEPAPTRRSIAWLNAVRRYRDVRIVCPSATVQEMLLSTGVEPELCQLIPPGVDFATVRRRRDAALRQSLGFDQDHFVMLAVGETSKAACHRDAAWAAGILHVLDPRYALLLWGRGDDLPRVMQFARRQEGMARVEVAERRLGRQVDFEELVPAADMALLSACGAVPTLPILLAMGAGLPIVSTAVRTTAELLEDRHNALLTPPKSPRAMAQRVLKLREDANLQCRLGEAARGEVYERYSLSRYLGQWRESYRQWVG